MSMTMIYRPVNATRGGSIITAVLKILTASLLVLSLQGCATTYIPVSWGMTEKVQQASRTDVTLATLFNRYDPQRTTLRVNGKSFDEVMMPEQVKYHLGAYRRDTKQIYKNLYREYNDVELRDLLVHELAHHIWFNHMSNKQQNRWRRYLALNPSPLQVMVRSTYNRPAEWDSEDFAYVVEYARPDDLEELAKLEVLTRQECDKLLLALPQIRHGVQPPEDTPETAKLELTVPPLEADEIEK